MRNYSDKICCFSISLKDWLIKSQLLVVILENLQCRNMTRQKGTNSIAERKEGNRKFYTNLFNFRAQRRYWSENNNLVLSIYNKKQPTELCQEQKMTKKSNLSCKNRQWRRNIGCHVGCHLVRFLTWFRMIFFK